MIRECWLCVTMNVKRNSKDVWLLGDKQEMKNVNLEEIVLGSRKFE